MTLHRRAIALLTAILTLQLTLAGDLVLCADVAGVTSGVTANASDVDMAGMDMTGMDMTGMDMAPDAGEAPGAPPPSAPDSPCSDSLPSRGCDAPLDGEACAAMIACATAAISIIAEVTSVDATRHGDAPISGATLPGLSRTTAPELPPPRA